MYIFYKVLMQLLLSAKMLTQDPVFEKTSEKQSGQKSLGAIKDMYPSCQFLVTKQNKQGYNLRFVTTL